MWSTQFGIVGARHRQPITGIGDDEQRTGEACKDDPQGKIWEGRREDSSRVGADCEKPRKLPNIFLRFAVFFLFIAASLTILFLPTSFLRDHDFRAAESFKSRSSEHNLALPIDSKDQSNSFCSSICPDYKILSWLQNSSVISSLKEEKDHLKIALLNIPTLDTQKWKIFAGGKLPTIFAIKMVNKAIKWSDLYPEWIDEEEQWHTPKCPDLPMPKVKKGSKFDIVIARVPCVRGGESWSRDVSRLQILLAAARVAVQTGSKSSYVLLCSEYPPLPNLFTCGELLQSHGHFWLYKVDLRNLKKKLSLPMGSCELSVPLVEHGEKFWVRQKKPAREAYATILHSAELYVCGAIAVAQSIRLSGSTRDLVILVDSNIDPKHRKGLKSAGWKIRQIKRIRNPKAEPYVYNEWNYSKFRLWQLTDYKKIIYIDADLLVLRNIDFLFGLPEISAIGNHQSLFNSGVMVIEPSNCTFQMLMDQINDIESYNGGDQGYLNEFFTWWHRLPKHVNFLKHFWSNDSEEVMLKSRLFEADPPILYVIHYLGIKPWLCFRDYDCNWNQQQMRDYASDVAHARWWKVHDSMSHHLQEHCLLRSMEKASLEFDRRQAEAEAYSDKHWQMEIKDPRLNICHENFCFWESMLLHWGETNETIALKPTSH